jgi:hypothetical protein
MAWNFLDGTKYEGDVHKLGENTFSGATRTPASRRLIEVPDEPQRATPSKPKMPRAKPEPKPKGASAWD